MSNAPKNEKKSVSKWKIFWIVLGSVVLLLAAAVITAVMLIFSAPVEIPERRPEAVDFYVQGKITQDVYRKMRKNSGKLCTLKLKENEVNSFIRIAELGHDQFRKPNEMPIRNLQLVYRNGAFFGEFPLDTGMRFLNGGVIRIKFSAKIKKTPQLWSADVTSVHIGKIPFSEEKAEEIANGALAKADMDDVNEVIQDIFTDEKGRLVITYYPEKLLPLLIKSLNKR